ncbi:SNF2-related protein [Streptomyces sp. NBC_00078]|uniref:SNF2-related protein n=1 Tax=unclassified Streptomyces TaxID=2593676 RepID=UPI00225499FD|nr:SNF2-related protein [Streptomyces sp. NBC_00078]MCX5426174.1 SNF2-related protein [Streptomyces sp. NBC_00078]
MVPGDPAWLPAGVYANEGGHSVAGLLRRWLREAEREGGCVTLTAGYVSFHGLQLLVPALRRVVEAGTRVRLLLGAEPTGRAALIEPAGDPAGRRRVAQALGQSEQTLRAELNGVPTSAASAWRLHEIRQWLHHPLVECRRWEHRFLHAKALVEVTASGRHRAVAGSFNLTMPGLCTSGELGFAAQTARQSRAAAAVVEQFWDEGGSYDLAALIDERLCPYSAELVYLRMLLARFGDEVNAAPSVLQLKTFQRDGVAKALAVMDRYQGALLADEVGLGKTYMAGEVIRRLTLAGAGPVLVVCPAHIKQSVWRRRLGEWQLNGVHVLSYPQLLLRVRRLVRRGADWNSYGLVVLDEAHCLRNSNTWRWALNQLLAHQPVRPKVLMLSATPVQNRGRDLTELLRIAAPLRDVPDDPVQQGRLSFDELEELCEHADVLDESDLQRLHTELDRLMVRRTRPFVVQAYAREARRLKFPAVQQIPVRYSLPASLQVLFGDVLDAVGHDNALSEEQLTDLEKLRGPVPRVNTLRLAAYKATTYLRVGPDEPRWLPLLLGLLRMGLLKRIESSVAAFAATASHMAERTRIALDELAQGRVRVYVPVRLKKQIRQLLDSPAGQDPGNGEELDYNTLVDYYLGGERPGPGPQTPGRDFRYRPAADFDAETMRADLEHDFAVLEHLARTAAAAVPDDPKPAVITNLLARISAASGLAPAKTVLFASSRVTTADLAARLTAAALPGTPLDVLQGRIASLGDAEVPSKAHIAAVLGNFAPHTAADLSAEIGVEVPEDLYDLLITTDMLAEGVNLQQAGFVIHYDLPWNPKILEQRLGRIDRLGSPHPQVASYTVLPDIGLDLVLRLVDRLMAKTRVAAACVGTPSELLPGAPVEPRNFVDLVDHLDRPQTRRGRLPLAEHQRVWLARAMREPRLKEALERLPLWCGAIHPGHFDVPGVIYCFTLIQPSDQRRITAFARVYGHPLHQAITLDAARCLDQAHLDLEQWLDTRQDAAPLLPTAHIAPAELHLVWELLDYARQQVATAHGLTDDPTSERIQLTAWMLLPHRTAGSPT